MSPGLACLLFACALYVGHTLPPRHLGFMVGVATGYGLVALYLELAVPRHPRADRLRRAIRPRSPVAGSSTPAKTPFPPIERVREGRL